ncbi:MAG: serine/threonine protein kinase, partial [Alistipes sp.]|nr:serine/threonine protein kinase [Alistipes sp.]
MQATNHLPIGSLLQGAHTYKIEQVLGQGAFGITYLASTRIKVDGALGALEIKTTVAIKEFFMRDINERAGEQVSCGSKDGIYAHYRHKFAREAENLSKLRHPNIVRVLEAFEANNTVYYAMEYCEGGSLDYLIGRDGLAEGQALAFVRQIASALDYMHRARILHLDLKPGNVMLREDGTVALIDFGLSKQYDEAGEPESSTTIGGGTPGYAPIEQVHYREGHDFPIQMDIYALGATLYKMLMGERPAEAAVLLNEGFPTHRLAAKGVSEPTIAVIEKAMSPIKRNRYGSVAEFLAALNSGTEGPVEPKVGENTVIEISANEETVMDQPAEAPKPIPIKEEIKPAPQPTPQPAPVPAPPKKRGGKKWLWTVVMLLLVAGGFWGGRTAMTHLREQQAIADSIALAETERAAFVQDSTEKANAAAEKAEKDRLAKEKVAEEKATKEKAEQERLAAEQAAKEKAEKERREREAREAAEKAERERLAREAANKTYKVGDYYNVNGKEGVVFYVDASGKHGKIVSMHQSTGQWTSNESEQKRLIGASS